VKAGKFEEWLPGTTEVPVAIGFFSKRTNLLTTEIDQELFGHKERREHKG
jgi:hypothetical protein